MFLIASGTFIFPYTAEAAEITTEVATDTVLHTTWMPEIHVATTYKGTELSQMRPIANTTLYLRQLETWRVSDIKELAAFVPNLYIPDYGSRMTSSIYVRGIGSRIEQPAMGVYIDGVPLLNKNAYDFDLVDARSINVLRGPQNTLYGRNTMGGVIDIRTLSPLDYSGVRLTLEAGNGGVVRGRLSQYRRRTPNDGWAWNLYGSHQEGFYKNNYSGSHVDWSNNGGASARYDRRGNQGFRLSNVVSADWLNQGGYPYRMISEDGSAAPIAYNDRCAYRRLTVRDGLSVERTVAEGRLKLLSTTSGMWLDDAMTMDQDFTTTSYFTLRQAQQEGTLNEDFVLKSADDRRRWNHLTGVNLWGRRLKMQAPVTMKQEGIDRLILGNANAALGQAVPGASIGFMEEEFPLSSNFGIRSYGVALYHHSTWRLGAWRLAAGLRVEHEGQRFAYDCDALVHLRVLPFMPNYQEFTTQMDGVRRQDFTEVAPSLSATYQAGDWTWHTSVARGYKAGGFNTQLFSDLLQQEMSSGLRQKMPGSTSATTESADAGDVVAYKPEYSWNYETGVKYQHNRWCAEATAFYIDCRDQQLTVFPAGMQTGRMMTNAGRTRSYGVESEVRYIAGRWNVGISYGLTEATFRQYVSGETNYRGKRLPYAPRHTAMGSVDWRQPLRGDWTLLCHADYRAVGPTYWDDANEWQQSFYGLLSASATVQWRSYGLKVWGKNLTDEHYTTFHFVSMQRHFEQEGKPVECGVTLSVEF
jgi:outer membrane receptor protein involved in Fe transport